ncbi:MAG: hypothetical protein QXK71_07750 [Pyrobaculum sp.]|jgi:hypothetical protein
MGYSLEHARVKELIEKQPCTGKTPSDVAYCIRQRLETAGYAVSTLQLLDSNINIPEKEEDTRFIRVESVKEELHIFTFVVLKLGSVYKALWLQSAVVEK